MKTLFLKNGIPIVTAILAIIGAFATTSMQNSSKSFGTKVGYTINGKGECNIQVECNDLGLSFCRLGKLGPMACGKNVNGQCIEIFYRSAP